MPVLRDHQRVGSGDHSDRDIDVDYGVGIEAEASEFTARKEKAREYARAVTILPKDLGIDNSGV